MYQALYLKWRPARFDEVVGQEHITETLKNAVAAGRLGHAYLFSGPRGTGKTTTARLLAKAANCLEDDLSLRPCGKCSVCRAIGSGRFLDLIEIDAASNTGVDDIRDLREKINFSPSEGRFKAYIIDEVHMLSTAAFNALLKTLEEPPQHAMFVLATTEEHKVPLTIKSRCQQFNFRLLTNQEISQRLTSMAEKENLSVEPEVIAMISRHAQGSLRDAESLLDQLVAAPGDTITLARAQKVLGTASDTAVIELTESWLSADGSKGLNVIHQALNQGADARQFTRQMVEHLRKLLLLRTAGPEISLDVTPEQKKKLVLQAQSTDRSSLINSLKIFNEAASAKSSAWQPQLPLELAFIQLLPERSDDEASSVGAEAVVTVDPVNNSTEVNHTSNSTEIDDKTSKVIDPEKQQDKNIQPSSDASATQQTNNIEQVMRSWQDLRSFVKERDRNLKALIASCKPLAAEGKTLVLGFDYPILKDKFDAKPQNSEIISDGLNQLLGASFIVKTVVSSQYIPQRPTVDINEDEFAALAEELGGKIGANDIKSSN